MPPKNKKKEVEKDERFQAIVLTDSFETRFMPLTMVKPRCLLPLANVPLIEYTLEFLAKAGVNEVYLMCSSHADQIQEYIEKSKWNSKSSPFSIKTVMSLESRSVGDTMRDLDNRGLISGDFLLVSGDVVTNIDFNKAMKFHELKKQKDKEHISTMVLSTASPFHRTRSQLDPSTFILDKKSDRCIYYQSIPPSSTNQSSINIDIDLLEDVEDEMVIRNDLIDCHVDICTPLVPQIFQDNFDYQYLRNDFVKGVLTSDLVKKTIYAYITDDEYAARVSNFDNYSAISCDILSRWCYPLVPDSNLLESNTYTYEFNHIYKENKVVLAQSCKIGNCTSIGTNTFIDDRSSIKKSVIGRNCLIGKNVTIRNSYIWDNVTIHDNSIVDNAIIATNVLLESNVIINSGSVLGFNVKIGKDKVIPVNTRIIDKPIENDDSNFNTFSDDNDDSIDNDNYDTEATSLGSKKGDIKIEGTSLVGEEGTGYLYTSGDEDNSDDDDISHMGKAMIDRLQTLNISDDSIASVSNKKKRKNKNRRFSSTSAVSTDYEAVGVSEEEEEDFNKEAIATITRSIENNHDLDTALLELNTLRMSMNVTYHDVRQATIEALVKRIVHFISTETLNAKDATSKIFNTWGALFRRQVFEPEEQVDLLSILQDTCSQLDNTYNEVVLFWAIQVLYQFDIVEEEKIYEWWDSPASTSSETLIKVRQSTEKFVDWLREAEEESESDSE